MPSPMSAIPAARLDQLKLWVIRAMLSRRAEVCDDPGFTRQEWLAIDACASQHRLRPLLQDRLRAGWTDWAMPESIRSEWTTAHRKASLRALDRQSVAIDVTRTLDRAGIASALLKGAALARHYGSAALRPMRDLDVLVAPHLAKTAFQHLIDAGFVRRAEVNGAVHTDYGTHKHLEALWCPRRKVAVEVHTALVDQPRGRAEDDALMQVESLLANRSFEKIGGHAIPVLGWAETMLHLIVHAIYDHQLNNGPLVLSDCAVLATDEQAADWDRFWMLAEQGGRGAGARLVFRIIAAHAPQLSPFPIPAGPGDEAAGLTEQSALLMLQDAKQADAQGGWDRLFAQGSWHHRLRLVRDRAALRARSAQNRHEHPGESGNLTLAWRMVRALIDPVQRRDVARSRAVFTWLQDQG